MTPRSEAGVAELYGSYPSRVRAGVWRWLPTVMVFVGALAAAANQLWGPAWADPLAIMPFAVGLSLLVTLWLRRGQATVIDESGITVHGAFMAGHLDWADVDRIRPAPRGGLPVAISRSGRKQPLPALPGEVADRLDRSARSA